MNPDSTISHPAETPGADWAALGRRVLALASRAVAVHLAEHAASAPLPATAAPRWTIDGDDQ